jgi:hypothetical protein
VAAVIGVVTPLQLIARAENNEQTYADLLVGAVTDFVAKLKADNERLTRELAEAQNQIGDLCWDAGCASVLRGKLADLADALVGMWLEARGRVGEQSNLVLALNNSNVHLEFERDALRAEIDEIGHTGGTSISRLEAALEQASALKSDNERLTRELCSARSKHMQDAERISAQAVAIIDLKQQHKDELNEACAARDKAEAVIAGLEAWLKDATSHHPFDPCDEIVVLAKLDELRGAKGAPAPEPDVCRWTRYGDTTYSSCKPEIWGRCFDFCPSCGKRMDVQS